MRVGFVRNVGLAVLGLAVAVTAACNDDPLSFDKDTTFDIQTNPSSMTVPAGVDVKLATRAVNQSGEPTWAEVTHVVTPACVTVEDDPEALEINPPGLFVVRGTGTWGACEITLSAGGVDKTVDVVNVAGQIIITGSVDTLAFEASEQFDAGLFTLDSIPLPMGPFENSDAVWTSSDDAVATVDANGLVTGTGPGEATITACWYDTVDNVEGYEICGEADVVVVVFAPAVTGISPASADAFTEVTVSGTGFVSVHQLYIDGTFPGNNNSVAITSITDTEFKFLWPALDDDGAHTVIVGVAPDALGASQNFSQTAGISAEPYEPENDSDETTPILINGGDYYIGGFGGGDFDDWIQVEITVDGGYAPVVDWNSGQDLDLYLYDAAFSEICHSWYSQPEDECGTVAMAPGTYWILVEDYSGGVFNSTYRLTLDEVEGS